MNSYSNWKLPTPTQAPPAIQIENGYFTHSSWRLPTLAEAPPAIQIEAQYKSPPQYLVGHRDNKRA